MIASRRVAVAALSATALGVGLFLIRSSGEGERCVSKQTPTPATVAESKPSDASIDSFFSHRDNLVEGPQGEQVRCETEALPCSYLQLKTLSRSGAQVPPELQMTREELRTLVSQLDTVSNHLARYRNNINQACIDGYRTSSPQVNNMGVHLSNANYVKDNALDLVKPEILLFAAEGGERLTQQEIGDCVDGRWTGDLQMQIVGASFMLPGKDAGNEHPDGFAGPLDNWHVHKDVCLNLLTAASFTKEECERRGGTYMATTQWMIHTYVVPEFDSAVGVFNLWNPSIWPKTSAQALEHQGHMMPGHDASHKEGHAGK